MQFVKKLTIGAGVFLLVGLLAVGIWWNVTPTSNTRAQSADPTATPATSADQPVTGTTAQKGLSQYNSTFLQKFADKLGVTVEKLKEAFSGAYQDTLNQAVSDGNLTQDQATQMQSQMQERLDQGGFPGWAGPKEFGGRGRDGMLGETGFRMGGLDLESVAKALGMTEDELKIELQAGKTVADVAKEKNVDLATVKASVLADLKTNLDQAVADGKLTQDQADTLYTRLEQNFDTLVTQTFPAGGPRGKHGGPLDEWDEPTNPPDQIPSNSPDA